MRHVFIKSFFALLLSFFAGPLRAGTTDSRIEKLLDQIVEKERVFLEFMQDRAPIVETYIQESTKNAEPGAHPTKDHYFLGRFRLSGGVNYDTLVERTDPPPPAPRKGFPFLSRGATPTVRPLSFLPRGFAQMAVMDLHDFNRQT